MKCKCLKCSDCIPVKIDNSTIIFSTDYDFSAFDEHNNNWTELTINGCIDVPEAKPDIAAIDSVHTEIQITSSKVVVAPSLKVGNVLHPVENIEGKITTGRKLIIEGLICYVIQYVAQDCEHSVHSFEGQVPFSAYIVLPPTLGVRPPIDTLELFFNITGFVENTMVKTACERNVCLCTTFILQPTPTAVEVCDNEIIDDSGLACSLGNSTSCKKCHGSCGCLDVIIQGVSTPGQINSILENPRDRLWTEFFIPELLMLPECKPDISKIVSVTSKFEILCQKVVATPKAFKKRGSATDFSTPNSAMPQFAPTAPEFDGNFKPEPQPNYEGLNTTGRKLVIEGMLRQRITYISCTETQSLHSAHFDVPVSTFIILPKDAKLTDRYKLSTVIEDIFICALNERQIFKNTTLFIKAKELTCN